MQTIYTILTLIVISTAFSCNKGQAQQTNLKLNSIQKLEAATPIKEEKNISSLKEIWENSDYKDILSYPIFERAMKGIEKHGAYNNQVLTIIDFSKPSSEKRLYMIDLISNKILYYTYVAHGKNTGENESQHYSNEPKSLKSSLGFYKTAETYSGKHGYSLKLDGLEPGINDNARARAIVMHGADYVNENFIKTHGRLGRSWGCPAVASELSQEIIDKIKGGSCLYIYDDNEEYLSKTKF